MEVKKVTSIEHRIAAPYVNEIIKQGCDKNQSIKNMNEPMEQDTADTEDIPNLFEFLLPNGEIPMQCHAFGFGYNQRVFDGWVKQPSPCCGASSVAGAWNALCHLHRKDTLALNHISVLFIYKQQFSENIQKKQEAYERKLGASIEPIFPLLIDELRLHGRELGERKLKGATKKVVYQILKKLSYRHYMKQQQERRKKEEEAHKEDKPTPIDKDADILAYMTNRSGLDCFVELYESEGISFADMRSESFEEKVTDGNHEDNYVIESKRNDDQDSDEEGSDDEDEGITTDMKDTSTHHHSHHSVTIKKTKKSKAWDWKADFMEIIKAKAGLIRLSFPEKPSTSPIGNASIIEAIRRLAEVHSLNNIITARLFMGKRRTLKGKIDWPLQRKDSEEIIQQQWDAFKNCFSHSNEIILFHLKNHYALIFAYREWCIIDKETGIQKQIRQLLSTRRGQRPSAWIDFHEARDVMLSWEGYKMIAISCKSNISVEELRTLLTNINTNIPH